VASTAYDAVHTRRIAFVADEYWVIEDELSAERPHRYDLRFHLAADAWGRVAVERRDGSSVVRAPGVALVVDGDRTPSVEPGWVASDYGVKHRAPVVSVAADATATTFTTLIVPLGDGAPAPQLRVHREGGATTVEVTGDGRSDTLAWSGGSAPVLTSRDNAGGRPGHQEAAL
jgi:hypothetical protein